jgi:hypothetical protein
VSQRRHGEPIAIIPDMSIPGWLKGMGLAAIWPDLLYLGVFAVVMSTLSNAVMQTHSVRYLAWH